MDKGLFNICVNYVIDFNNSVTIHGLAGYIFVSEIFYSKT
jgi:hypothetical protein